MFKKMILSFLLLIFILPPIVLSNDGPVVIAVGEAELETSKIAVLDPIFKSTKNPHLNQSYNEMAKIIRNDFSFYEKDFSVSSRNKSAGFSFSTAVFKGYKSSGIRYLVTLTKEDNEAKISLYDVNENKEILSKFIKGNFVGEYRQMAHSISDLVFTQITGRKSIFRSHIVFVSDRNGTRKNPVKELYVMDFDGANKRRLTHHRGTVISPAVSVDGTKILYSLIPRSLKNRSIRLMLYDMKTKRSKMISNRKGINAGAVFLPGEKEIVLTLSYQGNAELYIMNLSNGITRRITKHFSPDVDPSISYDGKKLTFLSGRSGTAMIYTLDPLGLEKSVKRISYVGKFNATPRFAPDGQTIVFSSWLDNRFDLFRLSSNGKELYRLTKDFGSNEDPTFSIDGQFIAFSSLRVISRRKADQNIYIMNNEGKIWGKVTSNFGNCITPRWSK